MQVQYELGRQAFGPPEGVETMIRFLIVFAVLLGSAREIASACSTKQMAYRSAMKSDLRNLAIAEEAYFGVNRRYTYDLVALGREARFESTTGVILVVERAGDQGWIARARHNKWTGTCVWGVGFDAATAPTCEGAVYDPKPSGAFGGATLLIVVGATVLVGRSVLHRQSHWWPVVPLVAMVLSHPSWTLIADATRGQISGPGDCGSALETMALIYAIVAGGLVLWQRRLSQARAAAV